MQKQLTIKNFNDEIREGLKLVEFYAPWCGHCKKQEEELKQMDKIWIGQVNTDEETDLALKHGISAFPSFILFNNGKEVERFSGFRKKEDLMNIILNHLQ